MEKKDKLFRVQSFEDNVDTFTNRNMPIRRVIISDEGEIQFNPDEHKYIYFSKTPKHHYYYLYKKVLKIIDDELRAIHQASILDYNIPENMKKFLPSRWNSLKHYTNFNTNVIKNVQSFFRDFLPPKYIELVSLTYLHAFTNFINDCSMQNMKKVKSPGPEVSDTSIYSGAYGINDIWLDLLKCSITSSGNCTISIDQFFDFLIDNAYYSENVRSDIERLSKDNKYFDLLNYFTYKELSNPKFYDKNNINDIIKYIETIERAQLYSPTIELPPTYFKDVKTSFKEEVRSLKD